MTVLASDLEVGDKITLRDIGSVRLNSKSLWGDTWQVEFIGDDGKTIAKQYHKTQPVTTTLYKKIEGEWVEW